MLELLAKQQDDWIRVAYSMTDDMDQAKDLVQEMYIVVLEGKRSIKDITYKDEINRYKKDGYVVPNFSMPEEVLKKIEFRHNKLLAKFPEFKNYCPAVLSYDEGFLEFCKNETILDYEILTFDLCATL